ncbi:hypothetical protein L218DRAFT_1001189 [Marasmius fiardii PR-910]|nr:hypothetical protein L218DRAFT_1001189 [Marasmius fiardii PR-910]
MAEYSHLSEIDPEIAPLVGSAQSLLPEESKLAEFRKQLVEIGIPTIAKNFEPLLPDSSEYTVKDHQIDVGGGATVLARSIIPTPRDGEDGTFPLLFWMHGGGWTIGNLHMADYSLRIASVKLRISVVNCQYRLAPEHKFPTAVDDVTAALKYVASHPDVFSASFKKGFLVGGQSAGGNLAAVLSWIARDDPFFKDTPLTGQFLQVPFVIHYQAIPEKYKSSLLSWEQNKDAPVLSANDVIGFIDYYKPEPTDPRVSPLLLSSHKGLPPAFFQICGMDPLRDEAFLYEKVLKEAGVPTKFEVQVVIHMLICDNKTEMKYE